LIAIFINEQKWMTWNFRSHTSCGKKWMCANGCYE